MKTIFKIFTAAVMLVLIGCTQSLEEKIAELEEKALSTNGVLLEDVGTQLVENYCLYAEQYPKTELSQQYLFKALDVAMNMKMAQKSLDISEKILTEYPDFEKCDLVAFMRGMIFDGMLHDTDSARAAYEEMIAKYPDSELVPSARNSIKLLGLSDEEIIRMFEAANADNTDETIETQ